IMKRMKDYGGHATCTQLSSKYGEDKNFYNSGSTALARRIAMKTNCPIFETDTENSKWWPILYVGKYATKEENGYYIWKLRDELSQALDKVDLSEIALYADASPAQSISYWWLNANPKIWSFSDIAVGEKQSYTLYNENGNKRRIFRNFLDAKAGDMIIGYESNPVKQIVALGRITAEQDGKNFFFEKTEGLSVPIDYSTLKSCPELEHMEYFRNTQGSLFKLKKEEYDTILDIIREENPSSVKTSMEPYDKNAFLNDVYMSESDYDKLVLILKNKMNIILQGPPGVGKTFAAKRLAYSIIGEKDENRIEFVQFHQNYSYEDFVMGYKPVENGFELKLGIFHRFCQKAANQPKKEFFFIIDEINRGNMSKIFGELLMLIEKDYRGEKATLAYNGMTFSVPKNLYIIGMMNTADRSLAMIDYALRRRFSFFEMKPGFDSEGFDKYRKGLNNEKLYKLVDEIKELNKAIATDGSLGKGFCIGHSYFCGQKTCTDEWLLSVVDYDILPMLSEYWFDDSAKFQKWKNILRGVFQ
ncbi:MAG TPA: AAA family ATPase, partial [Candidatus Moranbacteria bacterium]|nr:AAA family ATPase [Candidatus Moranbacteria bacterium]